jgi:hypothetical protein
MKNNLFTTVLTWLLATSVVLSIVFCLQYVFRTREMRRIQGEVSMYQQRHQFLNVLINDVVEYSKRDPGIDPVLESVGVRVNRTPGSPGTAAPAKPSAK